MSLLLALICLQEPEPFTLGIDVMVVRVFDGEARSRRNTMPGDIVDIGPDGDDQLDAGSAMAVPRIRIEAPLSDATRLCIEASHVVQTGRSRFDAPFWFDHTFLGWSSPTVSTKLERRRLAAYLLFVEESGFAIGPGFEWNYQEFAFEEALAKEGEEVEDPLIPSIMIRGGGQLRWAILAGYDPFYKEDGRGYFERGRFIDLRLVLALGDFTVGLFYRFEALENHRREADGDDVDNVGKLEMGGLVLTLELD